MISQSLRNQTAQLDELMRDNTITPEAFRLYLANMRELADQVEQLERNGAVRQTAVVDITSQKIGSVIIINSPYHKRPRAFRVANSNQRGV